MMGLNDRSIIRYFLIDYEHEITKEESARYQFSHRLDINNQWCHFYR